MRIEYCRQAGHLMLGSAERGTRGLWWEKRRALLGWLRHRGHEVQLVGRLSREAAGDPMLPSVWQEAVPEPTGRAELLVVEFGSLNWSWHAEQLTAVIGWVNGHAAAGGRWAWCCDDPDLPFPWNHLTPEARAAGRAVVNCPVVPGRTPVALWELAGGLPCTDLPFGALLPRSLRVEEGRAVARDHLVYVGRAAGRSTALRSLDAAGVPWEPYGRPKEWGRWAPRCSPAPAQPGRAAWYAGSLGGLAIADRCHEELGWRTGRIDQALAAGCPVAAPASHAVGAAGTRLYRQPMELNEWVAKLRVAGERPAEVMAQRAARYHELDLQVERAAVELGL